MKLYEEFSLYENLWNGLNEWVDSNGNATTIKIILLCPLLKQLPQLHIH